MSYLNYSIDFKVDYPRTFVDFDISNPTTPSITFIVNTGAACVEGVVFIQIIGTTTNVSSKTADCLAAF